MLLSTSKSAALLSNICGKSEHVAIGLSGNCWLGMFTTKPNSAGSGGVEVSSTNTNYSRVEIHDLMSATDRSIKNIYDINFNAAIVPSNPSAATGADWGTIVAFGLFTARTGGTLYAWGDLDSPVTVNTQSTLHFLKEDFEIFLDESVSALGTV